MSGRNAGDPRRVFCLRLGLTRPIKQLMNTDTQPLTEKKTKICPECRSEVNAKARRCPHCRHKFGIGAGGLFLVLIVLSIFASVFVTALENTNVAPVNDVPVAVGASGYLKSSSGGQLVGVASTRANADKITRLVLRGDTDAQLEMVSKGEVYMVAHDTEVKVLEMDSGFSKVQILEGDYKGRQGWVPSEVVR